MATYVAKYRVIYAGLLVEAEEIEEFV